MPEATPNNEDIVQALLEEKRSALSRFQYENGYVFSVKDLGNQGVKIELGRNYDSHIAIIVPPEIAEELAKWLLRTIGQKQRFLPKELPDILERLTREKQVGKALKKGDKRKMQEAAKVLRGQETKN